MFDFGVLQREKHLILDDRFRVRLLNKDAIPLIYDVNGVTENVVLIDLPQAEGIEAKILETQKEIHSLTLQKTGAALGEEKENLPQGCVKVGENLQVTFLSIEKLDKLAVANQIRMEENAFEIASLERFAEFDLHLVPQVEARMLLNRLSSTPGIHKSLPFEFSIIIFSEGSGRQNMLFIGINHTSKQKITVKGTYLGDFSSSINRLDYLSSSTNRFSLIDGKCRCRFDLLKENMVFEKSGNFIPAQFIIEAEWKMENHILQKHSTEKMQYIYLMKPPDYSNASILFKPGWKDARIALNDRISELRNLAELATHLKEGTTPWSGQHEVTNQPDVIDGLKQLIANAKIKLEAQPVFPFDFTDRLWDVLKLSKSIATLQRAFQFIYNELHTGEFQVLVESNKVSSIAKMLRMRNPNEIIFSRLEPMICLQFLVEIGLDRFNEELAYRFLENHFVTNSVELKPFFLPSFQPLEKRIEQLMPLHLALQSMIMIDQYVCVVHHEKANIAKRLLTHFTKLELTEAFDKVFIYKTKMENIRREKIGESLIDWILERNYVKLLTSGTKNGSFSNAVHISKSFGLKYLKRFPADVNATMIKQEVESPNPDNTTKVETDEENDRKMMQFECVYITTDRQPEEIFI